MLEIESDTNEMITKEQYALSSTIELKLSAFCIVIPLKIQVYLRHIPVATYINLVPY